MTSVPQRMTVSPAITAGDVRKPVAAAVVLTLLVLLVFREFFVRQFMFAIEQQADWGHTLVIPGIAGYFVYLNRDRLFARPFRTTWIGLVPIILGIAWYLFCNVGMTTLRHHNLMGAGVCFSIFGLVLLFLGFRATWVLMFPMIYLFVFGQTISERLMLIVTEQLQDITARGAYIVMRITGMDVERDGNLITVFSDGVAKPLNIAEACSGMRMLMAFLALGVAMAYTGLKLPWQRVLLVLLAFPTAIVVNIFRVMTLSILSLYDSGFAAGDFHTFIGLIWLVPAFLIYLGLMWVLRMTMIEDDRSAKAPVKAPARIKT